eukprot:CAMPEP_0197122608 /NCGR_PEP_ID=MMETSP1390-20130617/5089_1 /TAXON_ID=38833 /ORGANISM="Micromonas sp., Strain CCMP2099" /LENGTH=318 /DNA_ID=CAMNT_0042564595 /DNA_START=32 /DNA_END=985 /DNA_ORIENTATION=-
MGAGGESRPRWSTSRRSVTTEAPEESHHVKTRSSISRDRRASRQSGGLGKGRRQTSYETLAEIADWRRIGLHDKYADATMSRPVTRGWLHIGLASVSTFLVSTSGGRDFLGVRGSKSLMTFFTFTFVVPYWASSALHFIPWRIRVAHDISLVLDFLGISGGFAAQTVAWVGKGWWNVSLDDGFEVNKWAARLSVLATARLTYVLTYAVLHRTSTPVMVHRRQLRFAITGFNMLCLLVVETRLISSWRLNLLVQILGKLFVPTYFVFCVAVDSSSDFRPLPTKAKVWEAHENWHVVILVLHLLQFYAVSTHVHGLSAGV